MNRSNFTVAAVYTFLVLGAACQNGTEKPIITGSAIAAVKAKPAEPPAGAIGYQLQIPESFVYWKGRPVTGKGHEGTIKPLSGDLALDGNSIVGGYFELDMQSIHSTDVKDKGDREMLETHLKDGDFFDAGKFPKASFMLVKAVQGADDSSFSITGQLTIKNITREIVFPATILRHEAAILAKASLLIDRTKWGITYQSGVLGSVKDGLLDDLVPVSLNLVFKKK